MLIPMVRALVSGKMKFVQLQLVLIALNCVLLCLGNSPNGASQQNEPDLTYTPYMKGPVCQPSQAIRYPKTNEDVVAIVREALLKGLKVKAFGARHSMTDRICTDGIPMDMRHFQKKVFNADGSATFGAGVIAWDVGTFLKEHGRALTAVPAFGNITLGGAIGTGAHGSSIKHRSSFSENVIGLTIVDGLGFIRKISSESDLKAFRVHLGLLGIVLDVTLTTIPFYKIRAHNYEISDDILYDGRAERFARETDQISIMWWFPNLNKVVICNWTVVDGNTPGDAFANFIQSSAADANVARIAGLESLHSLCLGYPHFKQSYNLLLMSLTDALIGEKQNVLPHKRKACQKIKYLSKIGIPSENDPV